LRFFDVEYHVRRHYKDAFGVLKNFSNDHEADSVRMLRLCLYLCLVRESWKAAKTELSDAFVFFEVFRRCCDVLLDHALLPACIDAPDSQHRLAQTLKALVVDFFANLRKYEFHREDVGDWIYVVPFVHRWDLADAKDSDWLKLREWKGGLHYFRLVSSQYDVFNSVIYCLTSYRQPGLLCARRNFARSSRFLRGKIFFGTKVTYEAFLSIS
jgi:hypothetical protein